MTLPNNVNFNADNPFGDVIGRDWLTDLEQSTDFWNRSPQLQYIAWAAAQEKVSPWGLLMLAQLHRLSHIKPTVVLVKRDGSPGQTLFSGTSLNMFGCLTADSGGGKSVTFKLSSEIIPPSHTPISDGTGQGLVKSIAETEKVTSEDGQKLAEPYYITRFNRHSLVVHAPEIKTLNAEFARENSKTDSMMRSMWSGETVGMTTGDRDRRVTLPPNMYRIVGAWGVQAVNAWAILAGVDDGTPQRFLWMPGEEFRRGITRTNPGQVTFPEPVFGQVGSNPFGVSGGELPTEYKDGDPLPAPIWVTWSPQMRTDIAALQAQREALRDREPYADLTPEQVAAEEAVIMQSHSNLTRIKLAAMFAFLHGRPNPTDEDWELAGYQLQVSTRELAGVWKKVQGKADAERRKRAEDRGVEMHIARATADEKDAQEQSAFTHEVWQHICQSGPFDNRQLRKWAGGDNRKKMLTKALRALVDDERVMLDGGNRYWGVWVSPDGRTTYCPAEKVGQFIPLVPRSTTQGGAA
ncbi:hypothetical protein [Mycobacteroides abscessus]|uniref:hypothetical protein n=1 Tax=Mycobacteroides abscessus TaxID=36809 RepID=UPI0007F97F16|nr:hypothetical protein [Mycobacteroides abscessus]ANO12768.1 hypothetical protein BAB77_01905 [Mycobacteroides abscessus]ARQ63020.1 hypothetical protein CAK77_02085 [Mycobacteroides abscessus subsp. massiliense]MBE5447567.1 hypothetical protein [Mycobacteroides abscessus]MBE5514188.1 hypothetical protein [Mycobacteroides abscessus]MBN7511809.1 hypothetical protein [Mycobacteroides abscessus subsp. massiliense]